MQSKIITNEHEKMVAFKADLISRVETTLSFEEEKEVQAEYLRLPDGYEDMSETQLFWTLTRTPELQHTAESANLAIDILYGRVPKPVFDTKNEEIVIIDHLAEAKGILEHIINSSGRDRYVLQLLNDVKEHLNLVKDD